MVKEKENKNNVVNIRIYNIMLSFYLQINTNSVNK